MEEKKITNAVVFINGETHVLDFVDVKFVEVKGNPIGEKVVITESRTDGKTRIFDIATLKSMSDNFAKVMSEIEKTEAEKEDGFERVIKEISELHRRKNKDYGNAFESNLDDFGVTYGIGRLYEKASRAKAVSKNGRAEVNDESLADTIQDLATYGIMIKAYMDGKRKVREDKNEQ